MENNSFGIGGNTTNAPFTTPLFNLRQPIPINQPDGAPFPDILGS